VFHVRVSWSDGRHNPHYSRFDAVNNKYEMMGRVVNVRELQIPMISMRQIEAWFYGEEMAAIAESGMDLTDSENINYYYKYLIIINN